MDDNEMYPMFLNYLYIQYQMESAESQKRSLLSSSGRDKLSSCLVEEWMFMFQYHWEMFEVENRHFKFNIAISTFISINGDDVEFSLK